MMTVSNIGQLLCLLIYFFLCLLILCVCAIYLLFCYVQESFVQVQSVVSEAFCVHQRQRTSMFLLKLVINS